MTQEKFYCATKKGFLGYDTNLFWNGWYCPLFELNEAKKIIKYFNALQMQQGCAYFDKFTYLEDTDSILMQTYEDGKHIEEYDSIEKGRIIDGVKLYAIANFNYTWDKRY